MATPDVQLRTTVARAVLAGIATTVVAAGTPALYYRVLAGDQYRLEHAEEEWALPLWIAAASLALFTLAGALLARRAEEVRGAPTTAMLVGVLALVGMVAFNLSVPIVLGGLGALLAYEGLTHREAGHRGAGLIALIFSAAAFAGGVGLWLLQ